MDQPLSAYLSPIVFLLGSISVFMAGYMHLSSSFLRRFGASFHQRVARSDPRAGGWILVRRLGEGLFVGAVSGSSTAAVASLITLADADAIAEDQTPAILLGMNLGAVGAAWIIALGGFRFGLAEAALLTMVAALPVRLSASLRRRTQVDALTAVALVMLGLDLMVGRIAVGATVPPGATIALAGGSGVAIALLVGIVMGAVLRSTVGVLVFATVLAVRGWLSLEAATLLTVAGQLGVTVTGLIAARGLGASARRVAFFHVLINAGALTVGLMLRWLLPATSVMSAGSAASAERALLGMWRFGGATGVAVSVVAFYTAVQLLNGVVFLPFLKLSARGVRRLIAPSAQSGPLDTTQPYNLALVPQGIPDSLDANLMRTKKALGVMAEQSAEMLMIVMNTTQLGDDLNSATDRVISLRAMIKDLEEQITAPLTRSIQLSCTRVQAERIQQQQRIAQELSAVSDDCFKAMRLLERGYRKNYRFHQESRDELFAFTSRVLDFLSYIGSYLNDKIALPDWRLANEMEEAIDTLRDKLRRRSRRVLERNEEADVRAELAFIDLVSYLEHVGDRCLSIAETVRRELRAGSR